MSVVTLCSIYSLVVSSQELCWDAHRVCQLYPPMKEIKDITGYMSLRDPNFKHLMGSTVISYLNSIKKVRSAIKASAHYAPEHVQWVLHRLDEINTMIKEISNTTGDDQEAFRIIADIAITELKSNNITICYLTTNKSNSGTPLDCVNLYEKKPWLVATDDQPELTQTSEGQIKVKDSPSYNQVINYTPIDEAGLQYYKEWAGRACCSGNVCRLVSKLSALADELLSSQHRECENLYEQKPYCKAVFPVFTLPTSEPPSASSASTLSAAETPSEATTTSAPPTTSTASTPPTTSQAAIEAEAE